MPLHVHGTWDLPLGVHLRVPSTSTSTPPCSDDIYLDARPLQLHALISHCDWRPSACLASPRAGAPRVKALAWQAQAPLHGKVGRVNATCGPSFSRKRASARRAWRKAPHARHHTPHTTPQGADHTATPPHHRPHHTHQQASCATKWKPSSKPSASWPRRGPRVPRHPAPGAPSRGCGRGLRAFAACPQRLGGEHGCAGERKASCLGCRECSALAPLEHVQAASLRSGQHRRGAYRRAL